MPIRANAAARLQLVDFRAIEFFDKKAVIDAIGKKKAKALGAVGREIRYVARGSMKLAPIGVPSPKGSPPHRHRKTKKNKQGGGFWRSIVYGYDRASGSVVVGPSIAFGKNIRTIAERSEYGGRGTYTNPRRRMRKIGEGGEIRVERRGRRRWATAKKTTDTLLGPVYVVYARLRTASEAARANQINASLYGPMQIPADWPARPTMGPALKESMPRIPPILTGIWAFG